MDLGFKTPFADGPDASDISLGEFFGFRTKCKIPGWAYDSQLIARVSGVDQDLSMQAPPCALPARGDPCRPPVYSVEIGAGPSAGCTRAGAMTTDRACRSEPG